MNSITGGVFHFAHDVASETAAITCLQAPPSKMPVIRAFLEGPSSGTLPAFVLSCVWLFAFFFSRLRGCSTRNRLRLPQSCPSIFAKDYCG